MLIKEGSFKLVGVSCDFCSDSVDLDSDVGFRNNIKKIQDDGWRVFCKDDLWYHMCPSCVEDQRESNKVKKPLRTSTDVNFSRLRKWTRQGPG